MWYNGRDNTYKRGGQAQEQRGENTPDRKICNVRCGLFSGRDTLEHNLCDCHQAEQKQFFHGQGSRHRVYSCGDDRLPYICTQVEEKQAMNWLIYLHTIK